MAKVVKLNLKDIENIVKKTINEAEFDDLDTNIQPEELPGASSYGDEEELKKTLMIGKGDDGKIYMIDPSNGKILGTK